MSEYVPNNGTYKIRLDANESPYLPSPALAERITEAVKTAALNRYPDPSSRELINAFCERYGLKPENTVAGNGSDELISVISTTFLSSGERVLVTSPDFSMYAFYPEAAGIEVLTYKKTDGILDTEKAAELINKEKIKLFFFSNPCNPTGQLITRNKIVSLIEKTDCLIVCDEAYMEFSSRDESVLDLCEKHDRLIVLKTLSKAFGIAGMRVGFAESNRELIAAMLKVKSPYNVNSVSQAVATVALKYGYDEIRENYLSIRRDTRKLYAELKTLPVDVIATETNFVLLKTPLAREIFEFFAENAVAIRFFAPDTLRITCGTPEENAVVLKLLRKFR